MALNKPSQNEVHLHISNVKREEIERMFTVVRTIRQEKLDQRGLHQFLHQEAEGGCRRLGRIDWIRHKRMKTETLR